VSKSHLEDKFDLIVLALELPEPEREHRFHHPRRWRFDRAWPDRLIAAEIEGGIWSHGRHTRGSGFEGDCEKYNAAALEGWTVLRFTSGMIDSGLAARTLELAFSEAS